MDKFARIKELKQLSKKSIPSDVIPSDLFLKDEDGHTFFEFIVKNDLNINDESLKKYISRDYDLLHYAFTNKYFLDIFDDIELLFDESKGKPLIEIAWESDNYKFIFLPKNVLQELFVKRNGKYLIESYLKQHQDIKIIPNILKNLTDKQHRDIKIIPFILKNLTDFDSLYNCLNDINQLPLMIFSNERFLICKTPNGITMLEELINMQIGLDLISRIRNKGPEIVEILFKKGLYDDMLSLDCNSLCDILCNYPDEKNNYINQLIQKYHNGENISFSKLNIYDGSAKKIAYIIIQLLKSNIPIPKNIEYKITYSIRDKLPIMYMYEIDKDLTIQYFDNDSIKNELKSKLLTSNKNIKPEELNNLSLGELLNYFSNRQSFIEKLLNGQITAIEVGDIYQDDLLKPMDNGIKPLEYAIKNNIPINFNEPASAEIILLFIKYKKELPWYFNEKELYVDIGNNKKLIDLLIENNYDSKINCYVNNDLRILDYCLKYNRFDFLNQNLIDELFIKQNGHFLAEQFINNDKFIQVIGKFNIDDDFQISLFSKGYKNIMLNAKENILLKKIDGITILEQLLQSGMTPTFFNYDFTSLEVINILLQYNRFDLLYNAKTEILLNYPSKENNYLQLMINCFKMGLKVNLEKKRYINQDNELTARCYIQMAQNDLEGFLERLEEDDLLYVDNTGKSLLYYLVTIDKEIALKKIIPFYLQKKQSIFTELKLLNIDGGYLNISYEKYNCSDLYRDTYNQEYDANIISPV